MKKAQVRKVNEKNGVGDEILVVTKENEDIKVVQRWRCDRGTLTRTEVEVVLYFCYSSYYTPQYRKGVLEGTSSPLCMLLFSPEPVAGTLISRGPSKEAGLPATARAAEQGGGRLAAAGFSSLRGCAAPPMSKSVI